MFEGLIQLFERLIDVLSPMAVIKTYERGVRINKGEVQVEGRAPVSLVVKDWLLFNLLLFRSMSRDVLESDGRPDYAAEADPLVQPGVRLRLKGLFEIEKYDMRPNPEDLGEVNVLLQDGTTLYVSATVTVMIVDPIKLELSVQDWLNSFRDTAQVFLSRELRNKTIAEISTGTAEIEKKLLKALNKQGGKWGLAVVDVGFPSLVPVKNLKIFGQGPVVTEYV